jgi:hypothetical protein
MGFALVSQIERRAWMGGILQLDLGFETAGAEEVELIAALLHGLYAKDCSMLVRYVRYAKAQPRPGFCLPRIKSGGWCLPL